MYHVLLRDASFWDYLFRVDEDLAAQARQQGCSCGGRLRDANLPHDLETSRRITEWAYEQVEKSRGQVWLTDSVFQHLGTGWRELLVA